MATYNYSIDPAHSQVSLSVKHMMIATVRGSFSNLSGSLDIDPDDLTTFKVAASIDASTFDTGNEQRDAHVKSDAFLDIAKFPSIDFKAGNLTKSGSGLKAEGELTLHGVTKPITISFDEPSEEVDDMYGNKRFAIAGSTALNRNDYGITIEMPFGAGGKLVGDEIKVELDLQFVRKP